MSRHTTPKRVQSISCLHSSKVLFHSHQSTKQRAFQRKSLCKCERGASACSSRNGLGPLKGCSLWVFVFQTHQDWHCRTRVARIRDFWLQLTLHSNIVKSKRNIDHPLRSSYIKGDITIFVGNSAVGERGELTWLNLCCFAPPPTHRWHSELWRFCRANRLPFLHSIFSVEHHTLHRKY